MSLPNGGSGDGVPAGLVGVPGPRGGAPFDLSALNSLLNDPSIRAIASQINSDPAFRQMAAAAVGPAGAAPPGGAAALGPAGAVDPAAYMQSFVSNPAFMQMAERLGSTMMRDPAVSQIVSQMSSPGQMAEMKAKMEELKSDPELATIMADIERGGPSAMMRYWNDPTVLSKLGRAMGGAAAQPGGGRVPQPQLAGAAAGGGGEDDDDDDEAEAGGASGEGGDGAAPTAGGGADAAPPTLRSAASAGDADTLAALLAAPGGRDAAAVNGADGEGRTALHFASGYGERTCVEALLDAKADLDLADSNGNSALHYAAGYGRTEVVALLVAAGASVVLKNADGKTAADVARMNDQKGALTALETDAYL